MQADLIPLLSVAVGETLYMVVLSTLVALIIGLPLGILLVVTEKGHIFEVPWLNKVLGTVINIARSFPFIILIVILLPLSRFIVGTTLAIITITSFTATAGAIGAGGLGSLAIRYGYMWYRDDIMIATVLVLIFLVQGVQMLGNLLAKNIDRKRYKFE